MSQRQHQQQGAHIRMGQMLLLAAAAACAPARASMFIPIESKALPLADPLGKVILNNVLDSIEFTKEKYFASLTAYQENTGKPLPGSQWVSASSSIFQPSKRQLKRQKLALTPQQGSACT